MTKDEALRLALEALKNAKELFISIQELGIRAGASAKDVRLGEQFIFDRAITAIKAALEAKDEPVVWNEGVPAMLPKQKEGETFIVSYEPKLEAKDEPVAQWQKKHATKTEGKWENTNGPDAKWWLNNSVGWEIRALYTHPPQQEAKDEPVVNTDHVICPNCVHQFRAIPQNVQKLMLASGFEPPFTTPPQRKPLTDEQIMEALGLDGYDSMAIENARAIEAAHGIKGEA